MKKFFILIFILFVSVSTVFWLTYQPSTKTSVKKVTAETDKGFENVRSKVKSYNGIYETVESHTHSMASGKAMVFYLDALREGDIGLLKNYLPEGITTLEEKRLISLYQALDYDTLKIGRIIPHTKTKITEIQLIFSVNEIEISKTLNLYKKNNETYRFFETNEIQMIANHSKNVDPVRSAILDAYGKWMDYQPATPAIVEFSQEGADNQTAYNYPLLLSLSTVKKIDKLRYDGPYFLIEFENIKLLISRTRNEVQAEVNQSEFYQLKGSEKAMKAMQEYAAAFLRP